MLVKLKSTKGAEIWVNPDHIVVVSGGLVNQSTLMLPTGVGIEIDESARTVAQKFGWDEPCLTL